MSLPSSIFDRTLNKVKANKKVREEGGVVAIPWKLPRLSKVLPGVRKGQYTGVTAPTKGWVQLSLHITNIMTIFAVWI